METKNRNENAPHGQDYQDEEIYQPDDNDLVQVTAEFFQGSIYK